MSQRDVIWDEEPFQNPSTHDGLLQLVSQSGEYLVSKRTPSVELKINDNLASMAEHVEYVGDEQDVFARMPIEGSTTTKLSGCAADEVFNGIPLADMIWDREVLPSPESHGLLYQLGNGDELLHMQQEAGFDECLVADRKAIINPLINDLIPPNSDMDTADNLINAMPVEVRWDEERQSDIGTHENLLQHLSLSVDDEKTEHRVKLNASVVFTFVSTSCLISQCMNSADQAIDVFPSKFVVCDEFFHDVDLHDGLPLVDVVWDEEIGHHISYRGGLLEQLANGGEFMGNEEFLMEVSLSPLLSAETSMYSAHPVIGQAPSLNVVWGDGMSEDCDLCHGFQAEGEKSITGSFDDVLTHVSEVVVLEMCNLNLEKDTLLELEQPCLKPSTNIAESVVSNMYLLTLNKWFGFHGDHKLMVSRELQKATYELHWSECEHLSKETLQLNSVNFVYAKTQIGGMEFKLSDGVLVKYELGVSDQLDTRLSSWLFSQGQWSLVIQLVITKMSTLSYDDNFSLCSTVKQPMLMKLAAWRHGNFSPGESEQQLFSRRMSSRQWDPGIMSTVA